MLLEVMGAFAYAWATIKEKIILSKKSISVQFYQTYGFLAIVLVMAPFVFLFMHVSKDAYTLKNILILLLVVALATIANYLSFYAMKGEKISKLEPAMLMLPLFTILLAFLFSIFVDPVLYEKNTHVLVPAIIAAAALIYSDTKKLSFKYNKYHLTAMLGSLFFAAELVTSKLLLADYSPFSFYFVRCSLVFLASFLLFAPKMKNTADKKTWLQIFLLAAIWVAYRVIIYTGYNQIGIIQTTLIIMLGPVLIYFFAWKILKEKLTIKNIIASIIIVARIVYANFI
jgi:drug/metabolite transporter (DMT)-like permease